MYENFIFLYFGVHGLEIILQITMMSYERRGVYP